MNTRDKKRLDDLERSIDESTGGIHSFSYVEVDGEQRIQNNVSGNTYTEAEFEVLVMKYPDAILMPPEDPDETFESPYLDKISSPNDLYNENRYYKLLDEEAERQGRPRDEVEREITDSCMLEIRAEMKDRHRRQAKIEQVYTADSVDAEQRVEEAQAKLKRMGGRVRRPR